MLSFHRAVRMLASVGVAVAISVSSGSFVSAQTPDIFVRISDVPTVTESTDGQATVIRIPISLSAPPSAPFEVEFSTVNIVDFVDERRPSTPGVDYVEARGTIVFQPGQTRSSFVVTLIDDDIDEPTEFIVLAARPTTHPPIVASALLNIADDDPAPTAVPDVGFVDEEEGAVVHVPVKLQGLSAFDVLIDWTTLNVANGPTGQALSPDDYTASSGTLRIPAGRSTGVIDVPIKGDGIAELDEFVVVSFSNPQRAVLGGFFGLGFGVILDGRR